MWKPVSFSLCEPIVCHVGLFGITYQFLLEKNMQMSGGAGGLGEEEFGSYYFLRDTHIECGMEKQIGRA